MQTCGDINIIGKLCGYVNSRGSGRKVEGRNVKGRKAEAKPNEIESIYRFMQGIKKVLILLILGSFAVSLESRAQKVIQGEVRSSSGELVPYVTVTVNHTKTLSNSRGNFRLSLKSYSKHDTVFFSCVGFEQAKRVISDVESKPVITLQQMTVLLNEVSISAKGKYETLKLGNTGSNLFNKLLSRVNDQYALFIDNRGSNSGIIKTVNYFVKEPPGGSYEGAFRVRIYSINRLNGEPDKDLLPYNLIVSAKRKNAWFSVDVSKHQITMPEDGVFIAMEILPEDHYELGEIKGSGRSYRNNVKMACLGLNQSMDKSYSWVKNDFSKGSRNWRAFDKQNDKPSNFMININLQL